MARTKRYPGSIRQRGASWQVRLHVAGEYHTFTVRGTRTDAENFATTKADQLERKAERTREGRPDMVRFSTLLDDFTTNELPDLAAGTRRSYGDSFKPFRLFFVEQMGDPELDRVRRGDVKRYLAWRRSRRIVTEGEGDTARTFAVEGEGVSKHTVARDLRVLRRLFNFAIDVDLVDANPTARVRAPKGDPRTPPILSDDELDRLLEAAEPDPMLHLWLLMLSETGMRSISEAMRLTWEDVDLQRGFVHVKSAPGRRTKSGRSRWVPMTPRLRSAVQDHAARFRLALYPGGRSPYLFHFTMTGRRAKAGERMQSLRKPFERAAKAAAMPAGFRPHDLRHRRVTTWLAGGANPVHVKEAVGHADLATTMGYTHLLPEHLRALVEPTPSAVDMAKSMAKPAAEG
jgi:integrase/recombinase XerD